jgi:hypothetical protein
MDRKVLGKFLDDKGRNGQKSLVKCWNDKGKEWIGKFGKRRNEKEKKFG